MTQKRSHFFNNFCFNKLRNSKENLSPGLIFLNLISIFFILTIDKILLIGENLLNVILVLEIAFCFQDNSCESVGVIPDSVFHLADKRTETVFSYAIKCCLQIFAPWKRLSLASVIRLEFYQNLVNSVENCFVVGMQTRFNYF